MLMNQICIKCKYPYHLAKFIDNGLCPSCDKKQNQMKL